MIDFGNTANYNAIKYNMPLLQVGKELFRLELVHMGCVLYGDGIHDDTLAIQNMIDGACEVCLPSPKAFYLISKPLELPSNFRLVLPRFAEIRLADGANCVMLKNRTQFACAERTKSKLFSYLNYFSPEAVSENIEVIGGIWNFNNLKQLPNPILTPEYNSEPYNCLGFLFYNVRGLRLSSLTLKDPVTFAVTLDRVSYFSVDQITFDFNEGNPYQSNMDGIHLCGYCHHGTIEHLFGTCYDDTVAINAEEGSCGPITDITVRGVYTEGAYSAVRLLSASKKCVIRNIHISDIHGTFYHFCISFQRHAYGTDTSRGTYEGIMIDDVYAAKSDRHLVKFPRVFNYPNYALIDIGSRLDIRNLRISDVYRREYVTPVPTVVVGQDTVIENLILQNITAENHTAEADMPLFVNDGTVQKLSMDSLYDYGRCGQ